MKAPLYQGEMPAVSRVPQVQLPTSHPMQEVWDKNQARATQNAYALEDAIVDRLEYTREQELEAESKQLNADLKAGLDHALSLANGAPGSLFKADGTPNAAAIKSFANPYTARLTNWNKGFITIQSQQQAALAQQQARTGIEETVRSTVAESLKPRALAAFKQNYELSLAQGDSEGAINAAKELHARGYASDTELALFENDINQHDILNRATLAASSGDATAFLNLYTDPNERAKCNPDTLIKLRNMADRVLPPAPRTEAKQNANGTTSVRKEYPNLPYGVPDFIYDFYTQSGGQPAFKASPELRLQAMEHLRLFAAREITDPNNTTAIEKVKQVASLCGLDAEAANSIINPVLDRYTKANRYNPAETSKKLVTWQDFATPDQLSTINDWEARLDYLNAQLEKEMSDLIAAEKDIAALDELTEEEQTVGDKLVDTVLFNTSIGSMARSIAGAVTGNKETTKSEKASLLASRKEDSQKRIDELKAKIKAERDTLIAFSEEIKQREADAESKALAEYDAWYTHNKTTATNEECVTRYYDLLDKYRPATSKGTPLSAMQEELDFVMNQAKIFEAAYGEQASQDEYRANVEATDARRNLESARALADSYTSQLSSGLTSNLPESNTKEIIYLPANSTETRDKIQIFNGNSSYVAKVIKTDKVPSASLSNKLQLRLGILDKTDYNTVIFSSDGARLVHAPQSSSMADRIIAKEQRLDKDGNLSIYKLPEGDGGGTHEIAGINNKFHPEEYAELEALYKAGKHQEVRTRAAAFIANFTQPIASWLTTRGINSPAVENMLRDMYFNMGPGNTNKVILSAFAKTPIKQFLQQHSEQDLLQHLANERAKFYIRKVAENKSKAKFLKGWLNRTNSVLRESSELIK